MPKIEQNVETGNFWVILEPSVVCWTTKHENLVLIYGIFMDLKLPVRNKVELPRTVENFVIFGARPRNRPLFRHYSENLQEMSLYL